MSTLFIAFEDFILSREAMLCSPQTIDFYQRMLTPSGGATLMTRLIP